MHLRQAHVVHLRWLDFELFLVRQHFLLRVPLCMVLMTLSLILSETMSLSRFEKPGIEEHEGSIFDGPTSPPLREVNIGKLLDETCSHYTDKVAAVSRSQGISLTYKSLHSSSRDVAHSLLLHGVHPKDRVVVLAGNTVEYTRLLFAVGGIGAIFGKLPKTT